MSNLIRFCDDRRTSRGNLHALWLDGGTLTVYDAPEPADADTALTTQVALVTFAIPDPAGDVSDGVFIADAMAATLIAATGTAAWARAYDSMDAVIGDYTIGGIGSGEAIELDNLSLVSGAYATVVSFVVTEG